VGLLMVVRRSGNLVGPLLVLFGTSFNINLALNTVGHEMVLQGSDHAAGWLALIAGVLYHPTTVLLPLLVFYYPSGWPRVQSTRWFLGASLVYALGAAGVAALSTPGSFVELDLRLPHPFLDETTAASIREGTAGLEIGLAVLTLFALGWLVIKWRRGDGVERRQIGWLGLAALVYGIIAGVNVSMLEAGAVAIEAFLVIDAVGVVLIPIAIGVAIMRYRLYEIDVIISKSVTYLGLIAVIGFVYAAVVAGPLLLLGRLDREEPGLFLPIVATALVAILFDPIRTRMQRWADRLVYGERATPHQVLSRITSQLSDPGSGEGPDELAALLAYGTGAEQTVIWVLDGDMLRAEGVFPPGGDVSHILVADLPNEEMTASRLVHHRDEVYGAVQMTKARNDPISPADYELITDVAAGAGLMLRNLALEQRLTERARELRESRRRLIEAQDTARHRLERDLHDGAQQHVIALKVKLGLARVVAAKEGVDSVAEEVASVSDDTQEAVESLRAVAHGIYPPLLESGGLQEALPALARLSSVPVDLDVSVDRRLGRAVEETVYFCLRSLLDLATASRASRVGVSVAAANGELEWNADVEASLDDSALAPVRDRVDARDGELTVDTTVSSTRVRATLPVGREMVSP
jgi:signal transduction histidine kinase